MDINDIINATNNSGPTITSERHNANDINLSDVDITGAYAGDSRRGGWDAGEYGITLEEAQRLLAEDGEEGRKKVVESAVKRANLATINGKIALFATDGDDDWHGLGVRTSGALSAAEAIELSSCDFTVLKVPVVHEGKVVKGVYLVQRVDKDGTKKIFDNVSVGSRQTFVQPKETFAHLDALAGHGAEFVSAGALGSGEEIFATVKLPSWIEPVKGDPVFNYLVALDNFGLGRKSRILFSAIRPICANTHRIVSNTGKCEFSYSHTSSILQKIRESEKAFAESRKAFEEFGKKAELFAKTSCDPREFVEGFLDACVSETQVAVSVSRKDVVTGADALVAALELNEIDREIERKKVARQIRQRENLLDTILEIESSKTNSAPGTVWGAYQATTEYANHHLNYNKREAESNRFRSVLYGRGDVINQVAYAQAEAAIAG